MNNKYIFLALVLAVAVVLGVYLLVSRPAAEPIMMDDSKTEISDKSVPASSGSGVKEQTFGTVIVELKGYSFSDPDLKINRGTKVIWINRDPVAHTVTSDTGLFDSKALLTGQKFEYVFNQPGIYNYHCGIHPYMNGQVIVVE